MKLQNAIWTRLVGILMQKSRPALPFGIITGLFRCPPGEMMTMEASPLYCCCGLSGFGIGFFFLTGGGGTFLGAGFGGVFLATGCPGCPAPAVAVVVGAVEAVAGAVPLLPCEGGFDLADPGPAGCPLLSEDVSVVALLFVVLLLALL
jgi:hypothetical protein